MGRKAYGAFVYRAIFESLTHEATRSVNAEGRSSGFDPFRRLVGAYATTDI